MYEALSYWFFGSKEPYKMPKHVCKRALLHTLPHHGHLPITYISILRIFMSAGAASQAGGESSVEARKKKHKKKVWYSYT